MTDYLIRNAQILGGEPQDILIQDGKIAALGKIPHATGATVIAGENLVALPGMVDLHTHLRQPGLEDAETVFSGTRAAVVGGFTCVFAMANTNPVADTAEQVEYVLELAAQADWAQVHPIGAVTKNLAGQELSDLVEMANSKAKVRVFSDDGKCVSNAALMRAALQKVAPFDGVIAQHSQDPDLTKGAQMNESELCHQLGLVGWPAVAEEVIVARDCLLAGYLDARVHVCHLSTAGSVEIVRAAKAKGIRVTAEATPHHIYLTQQRAKERNPLYKVNPPLRRTADIQAVQQGLLDGTIDILATDHAPHPAHLKTCRWEDAAFGMTGLETALPVLITTLVRPGKMSWQQVAQVTSYNPARIGQAEGQGQEIKVGSNANLILVDPNVKRKVRADEQWSKSTNTPFAGEELYGKVEYTFVFGKLKVAKGIPQEGR